MSNDISTILHKLAQIESAPAKRTVSEAKISPSAPAAPQLPALFKPKKISPVLGAKEKQHPTHGYFVGDDVEVGQTPLEEAMKDVEEDVIEKVRKDLTSYLDALASEQKTDKELKDKAKHSVQDANAAVPGVQHTSEQDLEEDPTELDTAQEYVPAPVVNPGIPETALIKRIAFEDGTSCDIHGSKADGFEIRRGDRRLPTKFRNIDDAETAIELWKGHRAQRGQQDQDQDYVDER
jgi:hypothetical protein